MEKDDEKPMMPQAESGTGNTETEKQELKIDESRLENYLSQKIKDQNLGMGIVAGLVSAVAGAAIWAAITVISKYQIGFMAIGVGLLVGMAVRFFGKGYTSPFAVIGGFFSLFGCVLGNLLTMLFLASIEENVSVLLIVQNVPASVLINAMADTFQFIDIIFYGIAIYEGYKFSLNTIPEEDFAQFTSK
ncbi:MAG: hypothetical protein KDK38_06475 [Leptospiraceae bacterium]|nr:hypothetical protein [Leptospiraceae bacterium]